MACANSHREITDSTSKAVVTVAANQHEAARSINNAQKLWRAKYKLNKHQQPNVQDF
jgi:hypothetical protein